MKTIRHVQVNGGHGVHVRNRLRQQTLYFAEFFPASAPQQVAAQRFLLDVLFGVPCRLIEGRMIVSMDLRQNDRHIWIVAIAPQCLYQLFVFCGVG